MAFVDDSVGPSLAGIADIFDVSNVTEANVGTTVTIRYNKTDSKIYVCIYKYICILLYMWQIVRMCASVCLHLLAHVV